MLIGSKLGEDKYEGLYIQENSKKKHKSENK